MPTPPPQPSLTALHFFFARTNHSGDREDDSKYVKESPSFTGSQNYGWGTYSALNATHATWNWHTVEADGPGAKDFADSLTWIKNM